MIDIVDGDLDVLEREKGNLIIPSLGLTRIDNKKFGLSIAEGVPICMVTTLLLCSITGEAVWIRLSIPTKRALRKGALNLFQNPCR
ncbi:MAG: hypothetical protein CMM76_10725 [Rhodospirillaceae bacterium]|nr:hypothetical protein [Rhodospirillaceae bacterium]